MKQVLLFIKRIVLTLCLIIITYCSCIYLMNNVEGWGSSNEKSYLIFAIILGGIYQLCSTLLED